jgi:hypothetical protein
MTLRKIIDTLNQTRAIRTYVSPNDSQLHVDRILKNHKPFSKDNCSIKNNSTKEKNL